MEILGTRTFLYVSAAARSKLIERMAATKGDPSNRKVLITPDPQGGEELKVGIVADKPNLSGQVLVVDDIDFLIRPADMERVDGKTIDWQPTEAAAGRWTLTKVNKSIGGAVRDGLMEGIDGWGEQLAKAIVVGLAIANAAVFFGGASLFGLFGEKLHRYGPAFIVAGFGLAPPETLLIPGNIFPRGLAFYRRLGRAWWYYLAFAAILGFSIFAGMI